MYILNMFTERVQSRAVQKVNTRQKVLASAESLFRERGFEATTIRQIAAEAGVSSGTVIAAGDKEALLVAIFEGWIGAVHEARGAEPTAEDPIEALLALFAPFISYFDLDDDLSRQYAATIARGQHESIIFGHLKEALLEEITTHLESAGTEDPHTGAQVVYYAYLGLLFTASNGAVPPEAALTQLREVITFALTHEEGTR